MTQDQIITIALTNGPTLAAVFIGIVINNSRLSDMNGRINDMNGRVNERINDLHTRIGELRLHMDARFDDMRDTWRSELRRVEEVLDARLKHLEER